MALAEIKQTKSSISNALDKFSSKEPPVQPLARSFLFTILDSKKGNQIVEAFTLVLPPTAVQIREKARISITKTFGNIFVDDYGPDNLEIIIKGFSGTSHAFPTYVPSGLAESNSAYTSRQMAQITAQGAKQGYTHKTAFYTLRDNIMRYRYKYKDRLGDMILRVYDLYDEQVYDCVLLDFTVDRNSERPLYYPYSISLLVYNMPEYQGDSKPEIIEFGGDINTILNAIDSAMSWFDAAFELVGAIKNIVTTIKNTVNLISAKVATYLTQTQIMVTSPLDIVKQSLDLLGSMSTVLESAYENATITKLAYLYAKEMIHYTIRQNLALYTQAIAEGAQKSRTLSLEKDGGLEFSSERAFSASSVIGAEAAAKKTLLSSYTFSGVRIYTVRGTDTLQSIAQKELGDSNLWTYLAMINKITNNQDLAEKTQIYVPTKKFNATKINKDNFIITEDPIRDPYGTDIKLDESGNLVIAENNDFSLVSGIENVKQAVNIRLATLQGSVLKQIGLGITAQPGVPGDSFALAYLRTSIRMTLLSDPRIINISNQILDISEDTIHSGMDIEIVGADTTLPVNVTL